MIEEQNLTWSDIKEMFAETSKQIKEISLQSEKSDQKFDKQNEKWNERLERESKEWFEKFDIEKKVSDRRLAKLEKLIGGIGNNNGEMAEEFFHNAFQLDKTFANEKFDKVRRNLSYNNDERKAEFDIVLFNGKSIALIEVKYNAKAENISIDRIVSRVEVFKILCPKYKSHNIYLGVAAMSFKEGIETELHTAGIATIRPIGKKMVIYDENLKVF